MKVFILGSAPKKSDEPRLVRFCRDLGRVLGAGGHEIIVCSCAPGSADRAVLEGLGSASTVIVHRPSDPTIAADWVQLKKQYQLSLTFHDHDGPVFRSEDGEIAREALGMSYLLCQLRAIKDCDLVLTVGGKTDGSALLLLPIAVEQGKTILPYRFLGGAAARVFERVEARLKSRLGDDLERLDDEEEGAAVAGQLMEKLLGVRDAAKPRVFLSYSWRVPTQADLVETLLRRLGATVFRDEREIEIGRPIEQRINDEITTHCDLFVALWGAEYVASPYCHDEMESWIRHRGKDRLFLLRLDDTRPVWPFLRGSPENRETFEERWPHVTDRVHVQAAVDEILRLAGER